MTKGQIWTATVGLLLVGGLCGAGFQRFVDAPHRHARAVMTLAQFHLDELQRAVAARDCQHAGRERDSLARVKSEIDQAFPLTYAQDPEFRGRSDALRDALTADQSAAAVAAACPSAVSVLNAVQLACAACHREYR